MSLSLSETRYICQRCIRGWPTRKNFVARSYQWRPLSTSSSGGQRIVRGSGQIEKLSMVTNHIELEPEARKRGSSQILPSQELARLKVRLLPAGLEQPEAGRRSPGRIRGGRPRRRSNQADELETLALSPTNVAKRVRANSTTTANKDSISSLTPTPTVFSPNQNVDVKSSDQKTWYTDKECNMRHQQGLSAAKGPNLKEVNWYWQTFPPTFQERAHADHFFSPYASRVQPKLLTSAALFRQVPESDVPEVTFVGRSNVGKSSLLNAIVDSDMKKLLARTSSTPGFTKTMNMYGIGSGNGVTLTNSNNYPKIVGRGGLVIVDMPGYGEGSLSSWGVEIMKYIQSRKQLRRVFVLLDAEHGIKDKDRSLLASLRLAGVSHQVILSKVDKLYIPMLPDVKRIDGSKLRKVSHKGSIEDVRKEMEKMKVEIQPPTGGGALGEILACSSELVIDGKRFGIDHVRYAVLKAVGLDSPSKKSRKKAKGSGEQGKAS